MYNYVSIDFWSPLSESTFCRFLASHKMYPDFFFLESLLPTGRPRFYLEFLLFLNLQSFFHRLTPVQIGKYQCAIFGNNDAVISENRKAYSAGFHSQWKMVSIMNENYFPL